MPCLEFVSVGTFQVRGLFAVSVMCISHVFIINYNHLVECQRPHENMRKGSKNDFAKLYDGLHF